MRDAKQPIGFLGLGAMGEAMALNLVKSGTPLVVWNRTPVKAQTLAALGAETMDLYPWLLVFPALMLATTLFCFNVLGEGLRDALDPRGRRA